MNKIFTSSIIVILGLMLIFYPIPLEAEQVHRVKDGESIYTIAGDYGVRVEEVISLNNLRFPEKIYQKQVLIIPDNNWPGVYRVQPGETLNYISQQLRIPVNILSDYNNLEPGDYLQVYQVLNIPYRFIYPRNYVIRRGDTLYTIARDFNLSATEIAYFNNLDIDSVLLIGTNLKIPKLPPQESRPDQNRPDYRNQFPETFYLRGSTGEYKIVLTFDDGPDELYTPAVLDVLGEYDIQATFFLIGERAEKHPQIMKRIAEEGHLIGNHTWSHIDMTKASDQTLQEEITKTEALINSELNTTNTAYLRPPYGAVSESVLEKARDMGYRVIQWSVDSRDWLDRDVDKILINTLPAVRKDSIILFHSAGGKNHNLSNTVKVLPELIQTLRMEGYSFVNLDEILALN